MTADSVELSSGFIEPPRLEWHNLRPFAIARLPPDYARTLEQLALREEARIVELPVSEGWANQAGENPTGARYQSYNAFLLDSCTHTLYLALRTTYRFLLTSIGAENKPRLCQAWCNVHRAGQKLLRHSHKAQFIGYFAAHAEGTQTLFGPSAVADDRDFPIVNLDGQIVVTTGMGHFHEVTPWADETRHRVSYAFNIVDQGMTTKPETNRNPSVVIPFDGPDFAVLSDGADS